VKAVKDDRDGDAGALDCSRITVGLASGMDSGDKPRNDGGVVCVASVAAHLHTANDRHPSRRLAAKAIPFSVIPVLVTGIHS